MRKKSNSTKRSPSRTQTPIRSEAGLASLFRLRRLLELERNTDALVREATSLEQRLDERCRQRSNLRAGIVKLEAETEKLPGGEQGNAPERLADLHEKLDSEMSACPSDRIPGSEGNE